MINLACGLLRWSARPSILLTPGCLSSWLLAGKVNQGSGPACSHVLLENEFLLAVPQSQKSGGVAKVKLQCIVDVILVAELRRPISFSHFAKGMSINLYVEVKGKTLAFLLLKDSLLLFCSCFFISSTDIFCAKVTSLCYSKKWHIYFSCWNSFNRTQLSRAMKANASAITDGFQ